MMRIKIRRSLLKVNERDHCHGHKTTQGGDAAETVEVDMDINKKMYGGKHCTGQAGESDTDTN